MAINQQLSKSLRRLGFKVISPKQAHDIHENSETGEVGNYLSCFFYTDKWMLGEYNYYDVQRFIIKLWTE